MTLLKSEDSKKWINTVVAIAAAVFAFVVIRFLYQLGEWFNLEAYISKFRVWAQLVGIILALVAFLLVIFNKKIIQYLHEVYDELVKVMWPDRPSTIKATVGIVVGIAICSTVFVIVDLISNKILHLFY